MKYLAVLLLLTTVLISCKTKHIYEKPEGCNFGLDTSALNTSERPAEQKAGKPGRPAKIKNPPAPSSVKGVLLLDFDGHDVTGSTWNFGDLTVIHCTDAGLTIEEQQRVLDTVALRFSPFNMQVTTDEAIYAAAPVNKRHRHIITQEYGWFGRSGGVAVNGSFTNGSADPSFTFSILFNYGLKFIQECATHEVGHALGLFHQSDWNNNVTPPVKLAEYRGGWIMGIGYYVPAPVWGVGRNQYNQVQDDAAMIRAALQ